VIPFDLLPGAYSKPIAMARNSTALIIATSTTKSLPLGDAGVGFLTVVELSDQFLGWTGEDAPSSAGAAPTLEAGFGSARGSVMLKIDYYAAITLEVVDADHFAIHNSSPDIEAAGSLWILTAPRSA
jgi:hypothetical protein